MSNKETLAEHNSRLSAIKGKIEELLQGNGGSDGGSDGGGDAVLTISFGRESETEDGYRDFYLRSDSGAYEVDGGDTVYFENETTLTITGLSVGSVVELIPQSTDGESTWYNATDAKGCATALGGSTTHNGAYTASGGETVVITITEKIASVTVYEIYY